ncbi:CoA transferase [Pollutimonas nitritireducens]|uniref:CoA transferase n=1 Tax=Pollutimonas nitritireducens TaxID=2045209 RepID=A0A2N4UAH5_9BURK|nr:CoA transferase [Pollutimonas nitritireducens]PLC52025.1 CoA transferase [Pollutimonas nitritireducens]
MDQGPLSGIRVLDLTSVIMGPYATQHLGDLGADVIKVESPQGDSIRGVGPNGQKGLGPLFLNLNRNKRSVVLDLKQELGRKALLKLAEDADVLLYNIRPQAMERLGLGYRVLEAVNPRLIYVGAYGYGQGGKYAADPAFDDLIQAASGMAHSLSLAQDGEPLYIPITIVDRSVGVYVYGTICAALFDRSRSGKGQKIDIPMFETMTHMVMGDHLFGQVFDPPQGSYGYPRLLSKSRRPYRTLDGYMGCTVYTDAQWQRFFCAIGRATLMDEDRRFSNIGARTEHVDFVYSFIEKELSSRTTAEWVDVLGRADIPCFPVHTFESLRLDPHLADIGFFSMQEHSEVGSITSMKHPAEWSRTSPSTRHQAPSLGQHSREVLTEAGFTLAELDHMEHEGII